MKKLEKFYDQRQLYWMVLPDAALMIVFNYIPIYGVTITFKNYAIVDTVSSAPWVGLENFRTTMEDSFSWEAVRNTLTISLMKLFLGFAIPIILAVMIFEMRDGHLKRVIQTISYIPHFFFWIILGGVLISWFSTNGFINQVMTSLDLVNQGANHLLDPDKYRWTAALPDLWKEAGWGTIPYLAGVSHVDPASYEAARIDGTSKLIQVRTTTLPLLAPITSLSLTLDVSGLLGSNLDQTLVLANARNQNRSEVINSFIYRTGLAQGDFSYTMATGLGTSAISTISLVTANHITRKMNNGRSVIL